MASQNERAFRKWWWLVVLAVAVGLGGALVPLQYVKPEYQASCKLFVAGRPDSGTGEGYQAAQFAQARVAAYLDLLKGARVAEEAKRTLGLAMPVEELQGRITASAGAESVVMTVSVTDSQAQRSADIVNAVCTNFLAVAADAEGPNPLVNVRIIETASAPQFAIGPSRSRYLAVGGLAGLLAGLGLVVLLGKMRPKGRQSPEAVPTTEPPEGVTETERPEAVTRAGRSAWPPPAGPPSPPPTPLRPAKAEQTVAVPADPAGEQSSSTAPHRRRF